MSSRKINLRILSFHGNQGWHLVSATDGSPQWLCPSVPLSFPLSGGWRQHPGDSFCGTCSPQAPWPTKGGPFLWVRLWRQPHQPDNSQVASDIAQVLPVGRRAGVLILLELHAHHVEELVWVRAQVMHQIQQVLHCLLHNDCALPRTQRGHRLRSCFCLFVCFYSSNR